MFKQLAANARWTGAPHLALRVVADPPCWAGGAYGAGAKGGPGPGERETLPSAEDVTFERAVATWQARGYQVQYRDEYLVQLVRWHRLDWLVAAFVLAGLGGLLALAAAWRTRLVQPWHVVTLARTPDERVITHHQWSSHPPAA